MPNRAERRAQSKRSRGGTQPYSDRVQGRGRSTLSDEYALQERSRRLVDHESMQWSPSSSREIPSSASRRAVKGRNAHPVHSLRHALWLGGWALIVVSMVAFLVVMWLPSHPLWLIVTVSVIFIIGVLSLFLFSPDARSNPNLDANGTAL